MISRVSVLLGLATAVLLLPGLALACSLPHGYDPASDVEQDLRSATTVVRAEIVGMSGSVDGDQGLVVTIRRTEAIHGSGAWGTITLGDEYFLSCPNDYFTRDGQVRIGERLIVIGRPQDHEIPGRLFVVDEHSADADRLIGQWLTLQRTPG